MSPPPVRLRLQAGPRCSNRRRPDGHAAGRAARPRRSRAASRSPTPVRARARDRPRRGRLDRSARRGADRGDLSTADPLLRSLPGLGAPGAALARDAVEALFQRLASRAHGMPVAAGELRTARTSPPRCSSCASACTTWPSTGSPWPRPDPRRRARFLNRTAAAPSERVRRRRGIPSCSCAGTRPSSRS